MKNVSELWEEIKKPNGYDSLVSCLENAELLQSKTDDGSNLFHLLANNPQIKLDPRIFGEMFAPLPERIALLNEKNPAGHTPFEVALLQRNFRFAKAAHEKAMLPTLNIKPKKFAELMTQGPQAFDNEVILVVVLQKILDIGVNLEDESAAKEKSEYLAILKTLLEQNNNPTRAYKFKNIAISNLPNHATEIEKWELKAQRENAWIAQAYDAASQNPAATERFEPKLERVVLELKQAATDQNETQITEGIEFIESVKDEIKARFPLLRHHAIQDSANVFQFAFKNISDPRVLETLVDALDKVQTTLAMQGLSAAENLKLLQSNPAYLATINTANQQKDSAQNETYEKFLTACVGNLNAKGFRELLQNGEILDAYNETLWKVLAKKIDDLSHKGERVELLEYQYVFSAIKENNREEQVRDFLGIMKEALPQQIYERLNRGGSRPINLFGASAAAAEASPPNSAMRPTSHRGNSSPQARQFF